MIVTLVPLLVWVLALGAAAVAAARAPRPRPRGFIVDRLLRYLFLFPVGVMGLWAASGHIFAPEMAAASIGWQTSPFQFEVGVANLGLGVAGLYAAYRGFEARLAVNLVLACFLMGAGVGHLREIVQQGNFAPGNAGPILFTDFLTPLTIFVLLAIAHRDRSASSSAATP